MLYRLESAYGIREDLEDVVRRMGARQDSFAKTGTSFDGWARMGLPIYDFRITHVGHPLIGQKVPSVVKVFILFISFFLFFPLSSNPPLTTLSPIGRNHR